MIKKMMMAGGALALLSSLTFGLPLFSYARCGVSWLQESANDAMPLEWELKRARQMIADLKPEIEVNAKRIAREKVDFAKLEKQLDQMIVKMALMDLRDMNCYQIIMIKTLLLTEMFGTQFHGI